MWLSSPGSSSAIVKFARPSSVWKKATARQAKSRPATLSVLHLPDIIAKMTVSGSCRCSSSEARAGIAMKMMARAKACRQSFMVMPG